MIEVTHHSGIHNSLGHELAEEAELGLNPGDVRRACVAADGLREETTGPRHVGSVGRRRWDGRLLLQVRGLRRTLLIEIKRVSHG